jgi:hypothetical protein
MDEEPRRNPLSTELRQDPALSTASDGARLIAKVRRWRFVVEEEVMSEKAWV